MLGDKPNPIRSAGDECCIDGNAARKAGLLTELDKLDSRLTVLREIVVGAKVQLEPILTPQRPFGKDECEKEVEQAPYVKRVQEQIKFVDEIIVIVEDLKDRIQL
jgi:hypothetical protein